MSPESVWPWVTLLLLGAWHGLNPGMGWLFAAALGMQEGKGSAAWRALPPLALGHALSVGAVLVVALSLGMVVSPSHLRWGLAAVLVGYGLLRLVRAGHPRFGGMKVGARDLTIWSFLMASAHGAGLMVVPFVVAGTEAASPHAASGHVRGVGGHVHGVMGQVPGATGPAVEAPLGAIGEPTVAAIGSPEVTEALSAVLLHTGAYLVVTGLLAALVVHWLGLRLLRTLWIDLDRIWAVTLILTGVLTAVM